MARINSIIGSILILTFINVANAAEDEYSAYRYDCKARFSTNERLILQLEIPDHISEDGLTVVEIALHGDVLNAYYMRDGLQKRWYLAEDTDLEIILDAELNAGYYDFRNSKTTSPETMFECKKVKNRKRR